MYRVWGLLGFWFGFFLFLLVFGVFFEMFTFCCLVASSGHYCDMLLFVLFLIYLNLQVIRDVIGVHMEELSNHWQEENRLDNAENCEGGKSKSSGRYVTAGKFLRDVSSQIACNVILLPLSNRTYTNLGWQICTVYFILILLHYRLRSSLCMKDGEKRITAFLSGVRRQVPRDPGEQVVSGGAGEWIALRCPNAAYICDSWGQKDTWKYKYTISSTSLPRDRNAMVDII